MSLDQPPSQSMLLQWQDAHRDYLPLVLPDGTVPIPLFGARVVVCVGMEGQPMYACQIDNEADVNVFELCGYLDALKIRLLAEHGQNTLEELY